ncbi:GNAT family N-acetyltransferase [Pandoraea pulmonicola]|uniref:Acetyltransferase (GNAT) family n=1 Tax=Pandoraea pulmonicola TaxID=93221 RepID=A0AAJ5D1N6_PANPU|nr:GNAT family N-acetyltransferase [Pandoraea pulmonicola]AJC23040.2 GNAT family N-acetyltransferase [Pandoraea pulmonicola]SUA91973.1 Acetyltransferase (GNAT) family [Pandoraea pulmonicola]
MNTTAPTLRPIDRRQPDDVQRLQSVLEGAPGYSLIVEGKPPAPNAAVDVLDALPPGKDATDKFVYEVACDAQAIGCLEMVRHYPETGVAFIGLLLFREIYQGRGFGPQAVRFAEAVASHWQCHVLRLAVLDTNPRAFDFWKREGFVELLRKPAMGFAGRAIVMERLMPAVASNAG